MIICKHRWLWFYVIINYYNNHIWLHLIIMYQKNFTWLLSHSVCIKPFTQNLLNLLTTINQTPVQVSNILISPRKEGGEMLIPGSYKYIFYHMVPCFRMSGEERCSGGVVWAESNWTASVFYLLSKSLKMNQTLDISLLFRNICKRSKTKWKNCLH